MVRALDMSGRSHQLGTCPCSTSGRSTPIPFTDLKGRKGDTFRQARQRRALLHRRISNVGGQAESGNERWLDQNVHVKLPEELKGLTISDDGQYLLDSTTGQTINEFGATRFDVAVRALRGEFDPPKTVQNTERSDNLLIGALKQFPLTYTFNIVFKGVQDSAEAKQLVRDTLMSVSGTSYEQCQLSERLNGKYLSVRASACMQSPDMISSTFEEFGKDPRVVMKY